MFRKALLATAAAVGACASIATAQDRPLTIAAIAPTLISTSMPAWYPAKCAGIDYCAAVEHVIWAAPRDGRAAQLMFTSLHGTATAQAGFTTRDSRDHRMHVCMQFSPFGDLEVTCLLVPAS
jgi:hypothetical protein